jgi:hypothetical protein
MGNFSTSETTIDGHGIENDTVYFGGWVPVFHRNVLPSCSDYKRKAADTYETLVLLYKTFRINFSCPGIRFI